MLGGLRINILRLKLPRRVRNSELMEFYGYGIRIMYGRFKFWTEYRCSFHCLSIVFRLSAKVRGACDMLQLRICSDHRCFAPPLYSAQEVEPLQKLQKIIGTRDEKRTEGAMAFYDIDCNNSNNNHYHHHHYHYHHYLYKPLKSLKNVLYWTDNTGSNFALHPRNRETAESAFIGLSAYRYRLPDKSIYRQK